MWRPLAVATQVQSRSASSVDDRPEQTTKLEGNDYFAPHTVSWDMLERVSNT